MKRICLTLFTVLLLLMHFSLSVGQQADAPVYKDGEWWKVKIDVSHEGGLSRSGLCHESYPEYTVKIEQGKAKIYGVKESSQEEIECLPILSQLLGSGPRTGQGSESEETVETEPEYLKFPLAVGKSWTSKISQRLRGRRVSQTRWIDLESKVLGWEKLATPKGEFEAFKIEVSGWPQQIRTYYYAPKAKAIVRFKRASPGIKREVTLVDFSISE